MMKGFTVRTSKEFINKIDNLTLLDKWKNGFVKNELITKKCKKAYNISNLKINEDLIDKTRWTVDEIIDRQVNFSDEAPNNWRI